MGLRSICVLNLVRVTFSNLVDCIRHWTQHKMIQYIALLAAHLALWGNLLAARTVMN